MTAAKKPMCDIRHDSHIVVLRELRNRAKRNYVYALPWRLIAKRHSMTRRQVDHGMEKLRNMGLVKERPDLPGRSIEIRGGATLRLNCPKGRLRQKRA